MTNELRSCWKVPYVAHFCSLYRLVLNLFEFQIEDLEDDLIRHVNNEGHQQQQSLAHELCVRLLSVIYGQNINDDEVETYLLDILAVRYEVEENRPHPLVDQKYNELTSSEKIDILYKLCDWSMDTFDESVRSIDADATRLEPVGCDRFGNKYWYFYGTRLYREDGTINNSNGRKRSLKEGKNKAKGRGRPLKISNTDNKLINAELNGNKSGRWSLLCSTAAEWSKLAKSFSRSTDKNEKYLYATLSTDFVQEIAHMITQKEKLANKKLMLELTPRRMSDRIASKVARQKEDQERDEYEDDEDEAKRAAEAAQIKQEKEQQRKKMEAEQQKAVKEKREKEKLDRAERAKLRRERLLWQQTGLGQLPEYLKKEKDGTKKYKDDSSDELDGNDDMHIGMYKVLEALKKHEDSWPFMEPVTEDIAPGYFEVVEQPMDLETIEKKLEKKKYKRTDQFVADVNLIFSNCIEYNGEENCYTEMARKLEVVFDKQCKKHLGDEDRTSDEEYVAESDASTESESDAEEDNADDITRNSSKIQRTEVPLPNANTYTGMQNNWNGHPNNVMIPNVPPYPYSNYVRPPQYAPFIHTGQPQINPNPVHGHPFPHYYTPAQPVVDNHMHKPINVNGQQPNYSNLPNWTNSMITNSSDSGTTNAMTMRQMQNNKGRLQHLLDFGTQQAQLLSQPRHVFSQTQQQQHGMSSPYSSHLPPSSSHVPSAAMLQQSQQQFFPAKLSPIATSHTSIYPSSSSGDLPATSKANQEPPSAHVNNSLNKTASGRDIPQSNNQSGASGPFTGVSMEHGGNASQTNFNSTKVQNTSSDYSPSVSKPGSLLNTSYCNIDNGTTNSLNSSDRGNSVDTSIQNANGHLSPAEYISNYHGSTQQYHQGALSKQFYPDLAWQQNYGNTKEPFDNTSPIVHSQSVMHHHYPPYFQHQAVDNSHNLKQQQYHTAQFYSPGFGAPINSTSSEFSNAVPVLKNEIINQTRDESCN